MTETRQRQRNSINILPLLFAACFSILFVWWAILLFRLFPGHDQSWYLIGADRMLNGAQLYGPTYSETNPPLIVWFSALPVALARIAPLSRTSALRLIVMLMIGGCAWWCTRLLTGKSDQEGRWNELPPALAVVASALAIGFYDFGQREHLVFLCILPYLFAAANRPAIGTVHSVLLGLVAGLGVCFKPQQTITILAVELFLVLYTRSFERIRQPQVLTLMLTPFAYLAAVRTFAPLYLQKTVPILVNCYWVFGNESPWRLAFGRLGCTTLLLVALVLFFLRKRGEGRLADPIRVLLAASVGAYVAFCIQRTGWTYQSFPSRGALRLAVLLLAIDWGWGRVVAASSRSQAYVAAGLLGLTAVGLVHLQRTQAKLTFPDRASIEPLLLNTSPGETVSVLSVVGGSVSNLEAHHLNFGSRFFHLWMLPALAQNELGPAGDGAPFKRIKPEALQNLEETLREDVAEDLERWHPERVLVERCTKEHSCVYIGKAPFDTLAWLSRSSRFKQDWTAYRKVASNTAYEAYDLSR